MRICAADAGLWAAFFRSGGDLVRCGCKLKQTSAYAALIGSGVDYSFEAIGLKETAEQCFEILARGGTATIIGMIPQGTKIELDGPSFLSERKIQGSSMGSNRFRIDMPRYIEFYRQGRLKLDELVTQRLPLEGVNQAFDDMKQGHVARTVLVFD